jgi:hypothetical protein
MPERVNFSEEKGSKCLSAQFLPWSVVLVAESVEFGSPVLEKLEADSELYEMGSKHGDCSSSRLR